MDDLFEELPKTAEGLKLLLLIGDATRDVLIRAAAKNNPTAIKLLEKQGVSVPRVH